MFMGLSPHEANGTNRVGILPQTFVGAITLYRKGNIKIGRDGYYIIPTVLGSGFGAYLALEISEPALRTIIGVVMLVLLVIMLIRYNKLLHPIIDGHADIVYGSRFMGSGPHRVLFFFHTIGNKFLTFFSNLFTGLNLTDMETGYKMFKADVLKQIHLKENRFGFEPEVTAKASRIKSIRFYEVGIAYYGRTYDDGKKIKWTDGFYAIWCILKYNIFSRK